MKKRFTILSALLSALCLLCGLLALAGCKEEPAVAKNAVRFEVNGGKPVDPVYTEGNEAVRLPEPVRDGCEFLGWFYDEDTLRLRCTGADFVEKSLEADITVYAKWGVKTDIRLGAVQSADQSPSLTISYDYNGFDASGYNDLAMNFYYRDKLLASRKIGTMSSALEQTVCYGSVTVSITAFSEEFGKVTLKEGTTGVCSDEYNFAALNATFPVTHFSLDLYSRRGAAREAYLAENLPVMADAPTFVSLERAKAYDWDCLPENVYPIPNAPYEEVIEGNFHAHNGLMAEYIRELYEIDPSSKFNFYCVDNYPELILQFFVYQGIENYTVKMLSDGAGTISYFSNAFGGENAEEEYAKMAAEWRRVKALAAAGDEGFLDDVYRGYEEVSILADYPFVIASVEKNVEWWCARADLFTGNTQSLFIRDLISGTNTSGKNEGRTQINALYPGLSKMLAALPAEEQAHFRRLYKFDGEIFNDAYENSQKVLLIVGTKVENLDDLASYVKLLREYYKDEYRVYYKGHPGTPTELDPDKQKLLDDLDVTDINSSVAAELILFYCPDIYLVGYQSTTFLSAREERILALFNTTKAAWKEQEAVRGYSAAMYFSKETQDGKTVYRIEFDDRDSYAVFDPETGKITPYE